MRLRRDERGFVLIAAMIILAIFMLMTVAIVSIVNVQTDQTGHERSGEAAYNLAVSALTAEAYQLKITWPVTAAQALPACTSTTTQQTGCEGTALTQEVQATTSGPDYANATWTAQAFDNTQATYSASLASTAPSWDANADNTMFVRAQATANGQTRTVIEQVSRRLGPVSLPLNLVTAGGVYTVNNGSKTILTATDPTSGSVGGIEVRCGTSGVTTPTYGAGNCLGWNAGGGQLSPASSYTAGYSDPSGTSSILSSAQLLGFVQIAAAAGTLYNENGTTYTTGGVTYTAKQGCPPAPTNGTVVVVGTGACTYSGNAQWNSAASPGALIFLSSAASVSFGGSANYYGIVYMANQGATVVPPCPTSQSNPSPLVSISSSASINGAVYADGCGLVDAGDSAGNLNFMASAVAAVQSYQTATPSPGTFRVVTQ